MLKRENPPNCRKTARHTFLPVQLLWLLVWNLSLMPALAENHYKPEVMTHLQNGIKLTQDRQLQQAIDEFSTVIKMEPNQPEAYNYLGLAYTYKNEPAKAEQNFRKALDIEPLYAPALRNLGIVLYSSRKPEEALRCWQRCLELSTEKSPILYYYIANALRDTGRKTEARENYLCAIRLKPDNAAAYSGMAALDLGEGRLDDALREVKKAIKLNPDSAFSYYHLGLIEERLGDIPAAISAYQTSLKYETVGKYAAETKEHINQLRNAGTPIVSAESKIKVQQELARHDFNEAVKDMEAMVRGGAAGDAVLWNNLGLAYVGLGNTSKAVEAYKKAIQLRPQGFPEAQYNLGMVLFHMGENENAGEVFQKAITDAARQKKTNPLAHNMVGIIKRMRGDYEGADRAFKMAIAQSSDGLPVAHFNRALLLEHNENTRDAINEYKTYLMRAPNGKNAATARTRLKRLTGT